MKDNMEKLLHKAMVPNMEPSPALNDKILQATVTKKSKKRYASVSRVAAVILGIALATPVVVYATEQVKEKQQIKDTYITNDSVSMGNPEFNNMGEEVSGEEILYDNEKYIDLGIVNGTMGDKWICKREILYSDGFRQSTYLYDRYRTAVNDNGLDDWFSKEYENYDEGEGVGVSYIDEIFCSVEHGVLSCSYDSSIIASLKYNEGYFIVMESRLEGDVEEDYGYTYELNNTENVREYVNKSGAEFVLVDDIVTTEDGEKYIRTVVIIRYGMYSGNIQFINLSDEEIHQILDTVTISNDSYESKES